MSTLILNGSPRAERGNTEVFIRQFLKGVEEGGAAPLAQSCAVRYVAKEPPEALAEAARGCDVLLVFVPLYVHAMPGIVLKLFEHMEAAGPGRKIGFVVQQGFPETAQAQYLARYLNAFAKRLGYVNLGVVTRGDAAATSMMPALFTRKLFKRLRALGHGYAKTGGLNSAVAAQLAGAYHMAPKAARRYERLNRVGLGHVAWHKFWRDNGLTPEQGRARPFA